MGSSHQLPYDLEKIDVPSTGLFEGSREKGQCYRAIYAGTPTDSESGYLPGCIWIDVTNGNQYQNNGSATSTTWVAIHAAGDAISATTITATGPTTLTNSATATGAVALRLGPAATEGYEFYMSDTTTTLTNAVAVDTTIVIPAGSILYSVQGNLEDAVTGDGGGGDAVADIGLGPSGGDEDAYAEFGALTKNTKADSTFIPTALAAETTIAIFGLQADGNTAATEEFAAGSDVRVVAIWAQLNSLADAV